MRKVEIIGYGYYVPENTVEFDGQIRHRVPEGGNDKARTHLIPGDI